MARSAGMGNVVLKTREGLVDTVDALLGAYSEFGGAPLLGVSGLTVVGHGRSSTKAVRNAITMAQGFATSDFIQPVEREIATLEAPDL